MRRITVLMIAVFALAGCQSNFKQLKSPPKLEVKVDNQTIEATIGTYCWDGKCVDKAGPVDLVKGKKPTKVKANSEIKFIQNKKFLPTTVDLTMIHNKKEKELQLIDNKMIAPSKPGIYYFAYFAQWIEEKERYRSGDAQYVFVIKVE